MKLRIAVKIRNACIESILDEAPFRHTTRQIDQAIRIVRRASKRMTSALLKQFSVGMAHWKDTLLTASGSPIKWDVKP